METDTAATQQTEKPKSADGIDVDLTTLSSTAVYEDETTGQQYFACIIADALGC